MVKWVSAFRLSNNKWWWWMWFLSRQQAGLWLQSVGLVQRSAATWRCSAFITWTGWTLAMTLSHDDSTIIIVLVIIIIIFMYNNDEKIIKLLHFVNELYIQFLLRTHWNAHFNISIKMGFSPHNPPQVEESPHPNLLGCCLWNCPVGCSASNNEIF